ncbi:MAG: class I SAM-dependent methyltransferase [Dehalococcoidia bacterium]
MNRFTDPTRLLCEQYRDDENLNARVALHARFSTNGYGFHRWAFDQVDLTAVAAVLEVGCGPGTLWLENHDRLPEPECVTLSDFSVGMVRAARRALGEIGFAPRFGVTDVQALPFASGTFDAVIANHMLYHVPDRERAIAELRRVLRCGGRLYAATNGRRHMHELFNVVSGRLYSLDGFGLENGVAQLERCFPQVEVRRYADALSITEVEPAIEYVRSIRPNVRDVDGLDHMRSTVERAIASRGAFQVTKDAGVLVAMA